MTPESVIEAIANSGLRGRGGGGYPTRLKYLEQLKQLCDMGRSVPNPVLSTLRYFQNKYLALISDRSKVIQKS